MPLDSDAPRPGLETVTGSNANLAGDQLKKAGINDSTAGSELQDQTARDALKNPLIPEDPLTATKTPLEIKSLDASVEPAFRIEPLLNKFNLGVDRDKIIKLIETLEFKQDIESVSAYLEGRTKGFDGAPLPDSLRDAALELVGAEAQDALARFMGKAMTGETPSPETARKLAILYSATSIPQSDFEPRDPYINRLSYIEKLPLENSSLQKPEYKNPPITAGEEHNINSFGLDEITRRFAEIYGIEPREIQFPIPTDRDLDPYADLKREIPDRSIHDPIPEPEFPDPSGSLIPHLRANMYSQVLTDVPKTPKPLINPDFSSPAEGIGHKPNIPAVDKDPLPDHDDNSGTPPPTTFG